MTETWTDFAEFDGMNFDLEEYISKVTDKGGTVTLIEKAGYFSNYFADISPVKSYSIDYPDGTLFLLSVFDDIDSAKIAHEGIKNEFVKLFKVDRSCVQAIRVDNIIVWGLSDDNNQAIINFAKDIGIADDKIKLHKNNKFWLISRKDTDKSAEEIISAMEAKGYTVVSKEIYEGEGEDNSELNIYSEQYIIASKDYSTVYQLAVFKGDAPKFHCYLYLYFWPKFYLVKENACHIYYSHADGLSMFIMGVSAETRSFWNEIRK